MRLVQVSDTHFGTEQPEVIAALLDLLARLEPDAAILSGDITQRARDAEFQAAHDFVEALPDSAQRIVIPGNHDLPLWNLWRRFKAPYAGYERWLGPRESLWACQGVAVVALDATHPRRRKHGHLCPEHLVAQLQMARSACGPVGLLVVVAHQPLWTAWGEDKGQTLRDRHETARLLSEAHADVVLSGHVHVPFIGTSGASDPELPWRFVLSGAGTAVSRRTRRGVPNSFNLLELEPAVPVLHITRYDWSGATFAVKETAEFRRGSAGWISA